MPPTEPAASAPLHCRTDRCRVCESPVLEDILDLGPQPPANSLRRSLSDQLPRIPLQLAQCTACGAVQITETVAPEFLFRNYVWVTGTARTTRDFSVVFKDMLLSRTPARRLFVVEIASNDGTFLAPFRDAGHRVLGVDPALNIAAMAESRGIPTLPEFFGTDVARGIRSDHGPADCLIARNVIPHVAGLHDVAQGMFELLAPDGVGAIEFHYAGKMADELQYDAIYHEHLCYFSLHTSAVLLRRHGLHPFDTAMSPISGGALIVFFSKSRRPESSAMRALRTCEKDSGLNGPARWRRFARECRAHRDRLRSLVPAMKPGNPPMIGYGASARSATLLNFCGLTCEHIACIADGNPLKHGAFAPGSDIPIVPPEQAFEAGPGSVLLLAWNFRAELLDLIRSVHSFRGPVIVPLPGNPAILDETARASER